MNNASLAPFLTGQTLGDLARSLRLAVVQNQFDHGNLTPEQARELLCAELTPGKPETFFDDSEYLKVIDERKT